MRACRCRKGVLRSTVYGICNKSCHRFSRKCCRKRTRNGTESAANHATDATKSAARKAHETVQNLAAANATNAAESFRYQAHERTNENTTHDLIGMDLLKCTRGIITVKCKDLIDIGHQLAYLDRHSVCVLLGTFEQCLNCKAVPRSTYTISCHKRRRESSGHLDGLALN